MGICIRKAGRFQSKQGQLKSHFHPKARQLSTTVKWSVENLFTDTAAILNCIVLKRILWDAQWGKCVGVVGENLVLVSKFSNQINFFVILKVT